MTHVYIMCYMWMAFTPGHDPVRVQADAKYTGQLGDKILAESASGASLIIYLA